MSAEEIAIVELVAKKEMAELGYATVSSNWQLLQKSTKLKTQRALGKAKYYLGKVIKL